MFRGIPERRTYDLNFIQVKVSVRGFPLNPKGKGKGKGKGKMIPRYNFDEEYLYLCPNCGNEASYKMPELMAQHAKEKDVQNLKRECEKCGYLVPASRKN
jgi:DNA-directed RNA polymerase subunit M/transcription elongation factor TFIIS